ncbi:DUF3857 domain-containing protein [uncultured Chitinophaga sp.]|uniref:DUF3857 domain-containing protein n=1 Tax=uncultured Chitinophaga sp. TaxID=339340 RepID=UPI0025F4F927|nr:DUF3857 domain-containing protein [uncultured Chitinophaga sp.]
MSRAARIFLLWTGSLLLMLPVLLRAQNMSVSISSPPSWLAPYHPDLNRKPNLREVENGYYEVLYEEQHHVEKKTVYHHSIRRIITEAGVQNGAEISVEYRPAYEKLYFHEVQLRRNGKVISILDASKFKFLQQEKDLAQFIYSGTGTALLFPEDVRKGDELEYAYSIVGRNPIFENKYFNSFYFSADEPVLNFYRTLIASPERKLRFNSMNDAPEPKESVLNGFNLYEWDLGDSLYTGESGEEGTSEMPYTQVTEYTSWLQIIDWAKKINYTSANGSNLLAKIAELKAASGNDTLKYITGAIRFVQDDIRYMGIEMGEYSHRPNEPDKVLAQRFGDCKDKSLLLSTLLKAQGVHAYIAYVNTYLEGDVVDFYPSPYAFNHAIVMMDFHGKEYWIDPTIAYQRGQLDKRGALPYGAALVIGNGSKGFSFIKGGTDGGIKVKEKYVLSRDNYKASTLEVKTSYTGSFADDVRAQFAGSSLGSKERGFRDFYGETYSGVTVKDSLYTKDKEDENVYEVFESYNIGQPWVYDTALNNGSLNFVSKVKMLSDQVPYVTNRSRKSNVWLKYPYSIDYEIELHMPATWSNAPEPVHISNAYYRFDFDAVIKGDLVTLKYRYETFAAEIPNAYMESYIPEVSAIATSVNLLFSYNPYGVGGYNRFAPDGGWNWLMVALGIMFTMMFTVMAVLYSRRSVLPLRDRINPLPINGWLIIMGIGLCFRPFYMLLALAGMDTFYYSTWQDMMKISSGNEVTILQLGLVMLVCCQVLLAVFSVMLCFLFFHRRDIFPRTMIAFYIIQLVIFAAIRLLPSSLFLHQTLVHEGITEVVVLVMAAAWIPYLAAAKRVKETFVIPHDSQLVYEEEIVEAPPTLAPYSPLVEGVVVRPRRTPGQYGWYRPADDSVAENVATDIAANQGTGNLDAREGDAMLKTNEVKYTPPAEHNSVLTPSETFPEDSEEVTNGSVYTPTAADNLQATINAINNGGDQVSASDDDDHIATVHTPTVADDMQAINAIKNGSDQVSVSDDNDHIATTVADDMQATINAIKNGGDQVSASDDDDHIATVHTPTVADDMQAINAIKNGSDQVSASDDDDSEQASENIPTTNGHAAADDILATINAMRGGGGQASASTHNDNGSVYTPAIESNGHAAADDILATINTMRNGEASNTPASENINDSEQTPSRIPRPWMTPEEGSDPGDCVDNGTVTVTSTIIDTQNISETPAADNTAADNILKTIRFLHALRSQEEDGPMDGPNILMINENDGENKPAQSADDIMETIKAMRDQKNGDQ